MALGGVGEAMLLGAAIGGGSKALLDPSADIDDILKSAALGGATGFIGGGGIGNLLQGNPLANIVSSGAGLSGAAAGSTLGGEAALATQAGLPIAADSSTGIASLIQQPGFAGSGAPSIASQTLGGPLELAKMANPELAAAGSPFASTAMPAGNPLTGTAASNFATSGVPQATPTLAAPSTPSLFNDPLAYLKENKMLAGASALAGAAGNPSRSEIEEEEPWRGLRWQYRARGYADGGIASIAPPGYDMVVGETPMYAGGGMADLGTYSDGGRMLKGPGDGMSDSIPGVIAGKRPARLADGEFVVPADVVSHLGNGSTDAGAKQLYKMMDKVRAARTGTKKQGREINPRRFMPA